MKQELLQLKSSKELISIVISNDSNLLDLKKMFIGAGTQSFILKGPNDKIKEVIMKVTQLQSCIKIHFHHQHNCKRA